MSVNPLYVHIPAHLLPDRLSFLIDRRLQPEVACQEVALEKLDFDLLAACADRLNRHGLSITLHAPYSGFNPGSGMKHKRKRAYQIAESSLLLAEKLRARRVVFHPGLAHDSTDRQIDRWLDHCFDFWQDVLPRAEEIQTVICLENIYEAGPDIFTRLLTAVNSPRLGHAFDIGHWNIFGKTALTTWLDRLEPHLYHLHLHDNHGERDEHLALGQGNIPFSDLFAWLGRSQARPTMTIENHSLPRTEKSLALMASRLPGLLS